MHSELVAYAIWLVVGFVSGFVNTLAGGGSLLTLPAFLLTGLSAAEANATNRIAIFLQSVSGAAGFARTGQLDRRLAFWATLPTLLGAGIGAHVAATVPEKPLRILLLVVLVVMGIVMWRDPKPSPSDPSVTEVDEPTPSRLRPSVIAALFAAGLYGGFLQAGVGLVLLGILSGLLRLDLVRANGVKVVVAGGFSLLALVVFGSHGLLRWAPGFIVAAGSMVGAQVAVRFAVKRGDRGLRRLVVFCVWVSVVAVVVRVGFS